MFMNNKIIVIYFLFLQTYIVGLFKPHCSWNNDFESKLAICLNNLIHPTPPHTPPWVQIPHSLHHWKGMTMCLTNYPKILRHFSSQILHIMDKAMNYEQHGAPVNNSCTFTVGYICFRLISNSFYSIGQSSKKIPFCSLYSLNLIVIMMMWLSSFTGCLESSSAHQVEHLLHNQSATLRPIVPLIVWSTFLTTAVAGQEHTRQEDGITLCACPCAHGQRLFKR